MAKNLEPLKNRMEAADKVRIASPGTDLTVSIQGIPVVPCAGGHRQLWSIHVSRLF